MKNILLAIALLGASAFAQEIQPASGGGGKPTSAAKVDIMDSSSNCAAAGANTTTYTCSLSPAITGYVTGIHYRFKADVANTAASTINFNSIGAKTIKKAAGGITTDLAANDLQAGQWVDLVYDGTNMQMQSLLGNAASGGSLSVSGTAVSSSNLVPTPYGAYVGRVFGAFGANIGEEQSFPQNSNIYVFGDSTATLTTQSGDSSAPNGLLGRAGYTGELFSNAGNGVTQGWAVSGDQWEDVSIRVWAHISDWWLASNATGQLQAATVLMTPGINNANFKGNNTYRTTITRPTIYAAMTGAMLTASNFTFGQAAGCVKTGTWTTDNATFTNASVPVDLVSGVVEVSNTQNDTIACPITTTSNSPVGIIIYGMKDSNAGTFTLSSSAGACTDVVTGGTTINAFGGAAIATNNGATVTIGAVLCPLVAGVYTMTATVTSATNASNKVWIFGMGALPAFPGHRSTVAPMVAGGVLRARTDTNATQTDLFDTENMNACARLSATYNFPCQFVPLHTYTVATLPGSPLTGAIADVSDASTTTSCATGSGTKVVRCRYNGSSWDAQIGGVPPISLPTASGFYTDGLHPNRAGHALIYEQLAPFFPARVSNNTTGLGFSPDNSQSATVGTIAPVECFTAIGGGTPSLAVGDCSSQGAVNGHLNVSGGTIDASILNVYDTSGPTIQWQQGGQNKFLLGCSTCRLGFTSGSGTASEDITVSRDAAGVAKFNGTSAGDGLGSVKAAKILSTANCAAVGTSASPSVASCSAASAGHFSCATNATGATCTVNTTAVTANSEIFVFESDTSVTGTALGVTCNTSTTVNPATRLLASSVAATSFTINLGTVTTNPACFSFFIVN